MTSAPSLTLHASPHHQAAVATGWFIVAQVKSNRIVYFTDDPDYQPTMAGNWYFVTHFQGDLPAGMTLRNCWSWRFNGNVFQDAREPEPKSPLETLMASNRNALLGLLRDKINLCRSHLAPTCTLGSEVRSQKLNQAKNFLAQVAQGYVPENNNPSHFNLLRTVATARNISLHEAAQLIESRDRDTARMLVVTEQLRERYTQAIHRAQTQEELIQLRRELLEEVLPELSRKMVYPASFFEPEDWHKPLSELHRMHEVTRLQVQLRELINSRRAKVQSHYLQEDVLTKHKAHLAQIILSNDGNKPEGVDFSLLQNYAQARNLSLMDAARLMLGTMNEAEQVLIRTEMLKDTMQAKIETVTTLNDIRNMSRELEMLAATGRVTGNTGAVS